jgi:hypothetical protein
MASAVNRPIGQSVRAAAALELEVRLALLFQIMVLTWPREDHVQNGQSPRF